MVKLRRPHSKNEADALNPEPTPEKAPLIVNYDAEGNRIGDDGYVMTPIRKRMHTLFNAAFIWGIICVVVCLVCMITAYAQGQQYSGFELEVSGGNTYNGYSVATLLRFEALLALLTAIAGPVLSIQGFKWFYDRVRVNFTAGIMVIVGVISLIYFVALLSVVGIPDPVSLITLVFYVVIALTMKQVVNERPTLKKAKVARSETK